MDFSGDVGAWQRRVAEGPEGAVRRMATFEALSPRPGGAFLDLGCGGGLLARDLAIAVGAGGRAVALDPSADQLSAAKAACAGLPQAEFVEAGGAGMPFDDGAFDGVGSIQVLEYIEDVDAPLREVRRVTKRGGKTALVSVLWDHFQFHGAEPVLSAKMMDAWRAHCPHQMLPLELPARLRGAGFGEASRRPLPLFNGALHENSAGFWLLKLVALFARAQGVSADEVEAWRDQLERADAEGRFAFVSMPMLTTATAV